MKHSLKKMSALLLSAAMLFGVQATGVFPSVVSAYAAETDGVAGASSGVTGDCAWTLDNGVLTISGSGATAYYDTAVNKTPWGYNIKKVIIEDGVTQIGRCAFASCRQLTEVTIASSVVSIGFEAFKNCELLEKISLPDSVTDIAEEAFSGCKNLSEITVPAALKHIGENAFRNTAWLKEQSDGLVYLGNSLYTAKGTLTGEVEAREGTYCIADRALYDQKEVTSLTLPESVEYIGSGAFTACTKLTDAVLPKHISELGTSLFNMSGIKRVTLPENLMEINKYMFSNCRELEEITLPEGLASIGINAFYGCSQLDVINNTDALTSIDGSAFLNSKWLNDQPDGAVYLGKVLYRYKGECPETVTIADGTTCISGGAFGGQKTLAYVELPVSLREIGDFAFESSGLNEINIPVSCNIIGESAFSYCKKLTTAVIGGGVTEWGPDTFYLCSALRELTICDGVKSIPDCSFLDCTALRHVTIPEGVTEIGYRAFIGCAKLSYVSLPESMTKLGEQAFFNCDSLKKLSVPKNCVEVGDMPFGLKYDDNYKTVKVDGFTAYVYTDSRALFYARMYDINYILLDNQPATPDEAQIAQSVEDARKALGDKFTEIALLFPVGGAFTKASADDYTYANRYAEQVYYDENASAEELILAREELQAAFEGLEPFEGDKAELWSLIEQLEAFIDTDEAKARDDYEALKDALNEAKVKYYYAGTQEELDKTAAALKELLDSLEPPEPQPTSGVTGDCAWTLGENGVLTISGKGAMGDYQFKQTLPWGSDIKKLVVQDGVTYIGKWAFSECADLEEIVLSDTVKTIGTDAFQGCKKLKKVDLGKGVETIQNGAFELCSAIEEIDLPDTLTTVERNAFFVCSSLKSISFPEGITEINDNTLAFCASLTELRLGDKVETIGYNAFEGCSSLETVELPDSLTTLKSYTFRNCSSLKSIVIPGKVRAIYTQTFENCSSLAEIDLGSVQRIGSSAFKGCTSLKSVVLPDSMTMIDKRVFEDCTELKRVTVPKNTKTIDKDAFVGCGELTLYGYVDTEAQSFADRDDSVSFVPLNAKGEPVALYDVNADGSVDITDATELQKHIAEITSVNPAILNRAVKDFSGTASISDVTEIQRKLAE